MEMIRTAIFDLGNVLLNVRPERTLNKFMDMIPERSRYDVTSRLHAGEMKRRYESGAMSDREYYEWVKGEFDGDFSFDLFKTIWNDIFEPVPKMIENLSILKDRLPLVLLSNTNALHIQYCYEQYPWFDWFSERILSFETGSVKPDPEIYRIALGKTNVRPDECVFLDNLQENAEAAQHLGIMSCQFLSPGRLISAADGSEQTLRTVFNMEDLNI